MNEKKPWLRWGKPLIHDNYDSMGKDFYGNTFRIATAGRDIRLFLCVTPSGERGVGETIEEAAWQAHAEGWDERIEKWIKGE